MVVSPVHVCSVGQMFCQRHWRSLTTLMDAVQFFHHGQRKQLVAALCSHSQRPALRQNDESLFLSDTIFYKDHISTRSCAYFETVNSDDFKFISQLYFLIMIDYIWIELFFPLQYFSAIIKKDVDCCMIGATKINVLWSDESYKK